MPYCTAEDRDSSSIITCHKCNQLITETQNFLICDTCNNYFHLRCQGISRININRLIESESEEWHCKNCKAVAVSKRKLPDGDSPRNGNVYKKQNTGSNSSESEHTNMSEGEK